MCIITVASRMAWVAFLIAALLAISFLSRSAESSVIRVLTILPYPTEYIEPSWNEGHDIAPAMNLAVEMINNRSDILSGYEIELVNENGGCEYVNEALISFISHILHQRSGQIAGLIGPGCSASTLAVLPLVNREQVTLINIHGAGSPLVEDRTLYPNSLGVLGSTRSFTDAIFALMKRTGWTRIAALFEESRTYFFSIHQALLDGIRSETNGTVVFASTVYNTYYPLSEIRDSGLRIIVVMAGPTLTQNIMCLAHHEGMLYPDYQWILVSREVSEFSEYNNFTYDGTSYECSLDLLINSILTGNILLNYQLMSLDNTSVLHSGLNFIEFSEQYREKLGDYNQQNSVSATPSVWAPMYFDAIWALALAFNSSGIDIGSYHRGNVNDSITLINALYSMDFEGVSGRISFNNRTGFVNRQINIYQVINGEQTLIGYVNDGLVDKILNLEYIPDEFGNPSWSAVALPVTVIFTMVTVTLAILVIAVHIITIVYRKHATIKATSTSLNHFIYTGCYLWIAAILLYIIHQAQIDRQLNPKVDANLCQVVWAWLLPIGYTLMFGTVSARTWRLYRIFTHYLNPGPLISSKVLVGFIVTILIFDVMFAITWTIIDPFQIENDTLSQANIDGTLIIDRPGCKCKHLQVWILVFYGSRLALLLVTIVLSLLTLNIHDRKFSTKFLRIFVYLFALVFLLGGSLFYFTLFSRLDPSVPAAVFDTVGDVVIVLVLVLLFFPPVWPVVRVKCESMYQSPLTNSISIQKH